MGRLKSVRTEGTKVDAGNEVGTRMGRTMYPGSGLSVEIIPLILLVCLMYENRVQCCSWSCVGRRKRGAAGSSLPRSLLVGECVVLNDWQVIGPSAWGATGGFYRRTRRPTIWIKGTSVGPGWQPRRLARGPQESCLVAWGPAGCMVSIDGGTRRLANGAPA